MHFVLGFAYLTINCDSKYRDIKKCILISCFIITCDATNAVPSKHNCACLQCKTAQYWSHDCNGDCQTALLPSVEFTPQNTAYIQLPHI